MKDTLLSIILPLIENVKQYIIWENHCATIVDPVFHIKRNRVNAEFCQTLIRLHDDSLIEPIINTLVKTQNADGSWNEIHPNYNQPSALVTSVIGEALLSAIRRYPQNKALESAKNYVLSQEIEPGYYLKSTSYTADHLNVDASCGAFLAQYGELFDDTDCLLAAERAAQRVCNHQVDGYYPYTTNKGNYAYILNLPCIHYQGVTMYYLAKIQDVLRKDWIKNSLLDGAQWLSHTQRPDGGFDWSKSGLMFAYHLSGSYAFACASFQYVSQWDKEFEEAATLSLNLIKTSTKNLVLRWDPDTRKSFIRALSTAYSAAKIGHFPFKERLLRFGYGIYRENARRNYSDVIHDTAFHMIIKIFGIETSTTEPSHNYQDMFMTTEVLDCLSYVYDHR